MSRPPGITVSALLMMLSIVVSLALSYGSPISATGAKPSVKAALLIGFAAMAAVVYFYWSAHNWARELVLIDSFLHLVPFHQIDHQWVVVQVTVINVGGALLAIYLLWYLNTREIRAWFAGRPDAQTLHRVTHFLLKSPFKRS